MRRLLATLLFPALFGWALSGCASEGGGQPNNSGGTTSTWTGGGGTGGSAGGGGSGGGVTPTACLPADAQTTGSDTWSDVPQKASVSIDDAASCARTYTLSTTQGLVDDLPSNPRAFSESPDQPVVRSGNDMFDALYALALEEVRECSVDSISDWAFNGGVPVPCPPGGCFETGRKWTYVWTRDTAYAVFLGLGLNDPTRARNSLEYKLSQRRGGGDVQIVQDTGSGGSYPVSTDRVVWAIGAWELLKYLDGTERSAFLDLAYDALSNTVDHDRDVVFDASDGLYTGEQSFLDWREQSYPSWVATDTAQIGMSKTLSTNVGHLRALEITAALAAEKGLTTSYQTWADQLRQAISTRLWLQDDGMFSSMATTYLDPTASHRFDLLGGALAVLADVGDASQRGAMIANYPHLAKGAPVIWPQQQQVPIYHNRAIWPFVTALWVEAAKKEGNAAAVSHGVRSLMRGAALNLSNMENFEMASGAPWLDDGAASGPIVNSQRQLWSVAGYLSMVQKVIFGLDATQTGVRFAPFIPRALRNDLFGGATSIALSRLPYRGGFITVVLDLGAADADDTGALTASSVRLNGDDVGTGFIDASMLTGDDLFEVTLTTTAANDTITTVSDTNYQDVFGPMTPTVTGLSLDNNNLGVGIDAAGETQITFDVYRDGQRVAQDLPAATTYWVDTTSAPNNNSHCYSIESKFVASGTRSQHAKPVCYWGAASERVYEIDATNFAATGGSLIFNHGKWHYEAWGDANHTLSAAFTPPTTGTYYLQLDAGNGAGPFDTGVTCAVKLVEVSDGGGVIASGYLMMPHLGSWDVWRESSLLSLTLNAGTNYTIVIREDASAINMSEREHFAIYDGVGGSAGRFNRVNVAAIKLLAATL
jgi:hypothetical protein